MKVVGMVWLAALAAAMAGNVMAEEASAPPEERAKANFHDATRLDRRITRVRENGKRDLRKTNGRVAENAKAIEANSERIDLLEKSLKAPEDKIDEVGALAAALDFERPLTGKAFRLALGTATYEGEAALALGLTAQKGTFDAAVGVSTTGDETLGKASVGVSF
jgi:hypothetical protein